MVSIKNVLLVGVCLALTGALPAAAQQIAPRSERVMFEPGSDGTVITERIQGNDIVNYLFTASAGQRLMVTFETDNPSNYFNVIAPDADAAMHVGSIDGNRFEAGLPADGDYTVRVYLMRNAARRGENAAYTLAVNIFGPGTTVAAPADDFADGLAGGPDFWQVAGVGDGDSLNLRAGPSTQEPIIDRLVNGDVLRNRGCRMSGGQRWCKVERADDSGPGGWVAGRYLRETGGLLADATVAADLPAGNGQPFNATGEVPCSVVAGQPTGRCQFGVIRESPGNAGLWIDRNGRGERYFLFESGKPVYTDSEAGLSFEQSGDLYLLRTGDGERYEIPEAVVFGG